MFFCEFYELFKNNFFTEHHRVAASNLTTAVFKELTLEELSLVVGSINKFEKCYRWKKDVF